MSDSPPPPPPGSDPGLLAGGVLGVLFTLICLAVCLRLRQRRRAVQRHHLDEEERAFQARLEAATSGVFVVNGEDDELELTAHEIEQIQGLEKELARKARGEDGAAAGDGGGGGSGGGGGAGDGGAGKGGGGGGGGAATGEATGLGGARQV